MTHGGYLFAAGGTGGHLFPAIAVAQAIRAREPHTPVLFVGSGRDLERQVLAPFPFEQVTVAASSSAELKRRPVRSGWRLWTAARRARRLLRERRPRVVVGCGGFAAAPLVYAAKREGVPVVLLEQNVLPGKSTRWLSRWADVVCLSFEESRAFLKPGVNAVVTGNPVRPELAQLRSTPSSTSSFHPLLLVLGGSLGAESLNAAVQEGLRNDGDRWRDWRIVHQTGSATYAEVRNAYQTLDLETRVEPFLSDVPSLLVEATLVVSRAGATTLAELACAGCAAVVVPWSRSADDHQILNARWYADRDAVVLAHDGAEVVKQANSPSPSVWQAVVELAGAPDARSQLSKQMLQLARRDATEQVLRQIDLTAAARPATALPPES